MQEDVVVYSFGVVFLVFSTVALLNFVYVLKTHPGFSFNVKAILAMVPLATTVRGFSLLFEDHIIFTPISNHTTYDFVLGGLSGYFFLSSYILLIIFWVVLLSEAHGYASEFIKNVKLYYVVLNVAIYSVWLVLVIGFVTTNESSRRLTWHYAEIGYATSLFLISATAFFVVGYKLRKRLNRMPVRSDKSKDLSRKIGQLTVFCTVLFLWRGLQILITLVVNLKNSEATAILSVISLLVGELIPSVVMMVMLTPRSSQEHQKLLNA